MVKYNAGNTRSVLCSLNRLGYEAEVTDDPKRLRSADKVIFPGVGEASTAMAYLREKGLDEVLIHLKQPFLGICLGMQLMCSFSEEHNTTTLGMFDVPVRKFVLLPSTRFPIWGGTPFHAARIRYSRILKGRAGATSYTVTMWR